MMTKQLTPTNYPIRTKTKIPNRVNHDEIQKFQLRHLTL